VLCLRSFIDWWVQLLPGWEVMRATGTESSKKGSGIHRDFTLYPAFRRLLLTGIIGQWQSVGQEGGYLG